MKYGYYEGWDLIKPINYFIVGAHILVVCSPTDYISKMITLENVGWELRDCIKVLLKDKTLQVGLLRKPFKGTVANNVLTNGCGGINIDATRIKGGGGGTNCNNRDEKGECMGHENNNSLGGGMMRHGPNTQPKGRFPANLLLNCTCEEVIEGKSDGVVINNSNSPNFTDDVYCGGWNRGEQEAPRAYKDTGAIHTDSNCPCKKLDLESGTSKSVKNKKSDGRVENNNKVFGKGLGLHNPSNSHNDGGGASRFFYQFVDENMLKEYLINLIKV